MSETKGSQGLETDVKVGTDHKKALARIAVHCPGTPVPHHCQDFCGHLWQRRTWRWDVTQLHRCQWETPLEQEGPKAWKCYSHVFQEGARGWHYRPIRDRSRLLCTQWEMTGRGGMDPDRSWKQSSVVSVWCVGSEEDGGRNVKRGVPCLPLMSMLSSGQEDPCW